LIVAEGTVINSLNKEDILINKKKFTTLFFFLLTWDCCFILEMEDVTWGFLQMEEEHPLYNQISMKLDVNISILS
jgi:hypothetical protein